MSAETEMKACKRWNVKHCDNCTHFAESSSEFGGLGRCMLVKNKLICTSKYSPGCADFDRVKLTDRFDPV